VPDTAGDPSPGRATADAANGGYASRR
jgi:hypothetical protein